jgi:tungstate transport system substrate-binding protein
MIGRLLALFLVAALPAFAAERFVTVASTTSTEQSGLFGHLLPAFTAKSGIEVRVVAVGTGQALRLGERGDADLVLVHDQPSELKFVEAGHGVERRDVMYNDYVLVGPHADPAGVRGGDAAEALRRIAAAGARFASRGDDSGTHKTELRLWRDAAIDPTAATGSWYRETGSGMGPTLNTAAGMDAYALTDRGTWLSFKNRQNLEILVQGDERLFNQYGVMLVNPARHPHVKERDARAFIDWLTGPQGQQAIAEYKLGGEPLFFPNARKTGS